MVVVGCTAEEEHVGTGVDTVAVGTAVEEVDVMKTTKVLMKHGRKSRKGRRKTAL